MDSSNDVQGHTNVQSTKRMRLEDPYWAFHSATKPVAPADPFMEAAAAR